MTDLSKLARKITWVLFANQSLASAGFIAASTINSIIGAKLGGNASFAGVPSAVYLLGGAFAASAWGYMMDRIGRRNGMVSGLLIGVIRQCTGFICDWHFFLFAFSYRYGADGDCERSSGAGTFRRGGSEPARETWRGDLKCGAGRNFRCDCWSIACGTDGNFAHSTWAWTNWPVPISHSASVCDFSHRRLCGASS